MSVGIVPARSRTPIPFFWVEPAGREPSMEVHINGLIHLDGSGTQFFFVGHSMEGLAGVRGKTRVEVSGYCDTARNKGHINAPADNNLQVGHIRALAHRLRLGHTTDTALPYEIHLYCQEAGLSPKTEAQILSDLIL